MPGQISQEDEVLVGPRGGADVFPVRRQGELPPGAYAPVSLSLVRSDDSGPRSRRGLPHHVLGRGQVPLGRPSRGSELGPRLHPVVSLRVYHRSRPGERHALSRGLRANLPRVGASCVYSPTDARSRLHRPAAQAVGGRCGGDLASIGPQPSRPWAQTGGFVESLGRHRRLAHYSRSQVFLGRPRHEGCPRRSGRRG